MTSNKIIYIVIILVIIGIAGYNLFSSINMQPPDILKNALNPSEADPKVDEAQTTGGVGTAAVGVPPVLTGAKIQLETTGNEDIVRVIPVVSSGEGAKINFSYEWTKNSVPAGTNDFIGGFKRGDKIAVKVTPFDGTLYGEPKTVTTEIKNSTPRIVEIKELSTSENTFIYQVVAQDADGDQLSYSLIGEPKGMTIDQKGTIRWSTKEYSGPVSVKVKVTDGQGGEAIGDINFKIAK
jgi:hypothetical protein